MVVLTRYQPDRNMARFYVLAVEDTLFGDKALLRHWGRIGTRGREIRQIYATAELAEAALVLWLGRKVRRGYGTASDTTSVVS